MDKGLRGTSFAIREYEKENIHIVQSSSSSTVIVRILHVVHEIVTLTMVVGIDDIPCTLFLADSLQDCYNEASRRTLETSYF